MLWEMFTISPMLQKDIKTDSFAQSKHTLHFISLCIVIFPITIPVGIVVTLKIK